MLPSATALSMHGAPLSSKSRPPIPTTSSKKVPNNPDSRPGKPNTTSLSASLPQRFGTSVTRSDLTHMCGH